ncbi:hypothetical protein [Streptomyces sp. CT34]|uniref:hypothetical protein n=1 Tax=Streptomyces sp. CT34 TaxID=1553907 RepID=UPI0005BE46BA|nr:hypothetical protein [Streptomyces sp. CT34]
MPRRTSLRLPFRATAARTLLRRLAVPLLLGGLLSAAAVPCPADVPHHHRTGGPVTAAAVAGTAADGRRSDGTDCPPDAAGRIPPARSAAGRRTVADAPGAAPAALGTAVRSAAARRPAASGRAARHGPPRGGRPTLAALCRCRI